MEISKNHFDQLLRQAAEGCLQAEAELFMAEDITNVHISPRIDRNVFRAIRRMNVSHSAVRQFLTKAAVIVLVVCSVGLVFCMCHPTVRSAFLNIFQTFYETHIGVSFTASPNDTPAALEEYCLPTVPDTWEKHVIAESSSILWYTFNGVSGETVSFKQYPAQEQNEYHIDNQPIDTEHLYLNGTVPASLYT